MKLEISRHKGLIVGIACEESPAWSAANRFRQAGARRVVLMRMLARSCGTAITGDVIHVDAGHHIQGVAFH